MSACDLKRSKRLEDAEVGDTIILKDIDCRSTLCLPSVIVQQTDTVKQGEVYYAQIYLSDSSFHYYDDAIGMVRPTITANGSQLKVNDNYKSVYILSTDTLAKGEYFYKASIEIMLPKHPNNLTLTKGVYFYVK